MENDPDREAYIRRQLTATHDVGSEDVKGGARVVEEGTGVGVEEVHIRRAQSEGNFDDNEAEEGEEDSGSGEEDFGGGAEGDMGDSGDFNNSGSFRNLEDDSIIEGGMAHGTSDRVGASLEGDVADIWTSPSQGRQSLQRTTLSHVVRHSLLHDVPSTQMEKRRKLVHATDSGDVGGPSMLARPVSSPPPPTASVEATTMAIMMPIAARGFPLRSHSLTDAFMATQHRGATRERTLVVPPPISANYNERISCCTGRIDQPTIGP